MKILIAVDLSDSTNKVVNAAKKLALACGATLWVLHVAEPDPDFVGWEAGPQSERDFIASQFHAAHRQTQAIADDMRSTGLDATAFLIQGPIIETILAEAKKLGADLIVLGSHGRGMMFQLLIGSVSEGVLHNADCPVLIVPTRE